MTQGGNPFGEGGFDMNALLQQAQQMQQQVMDAQAELAEAEVEGTVGDGLVTVTLNGAGELVRIRIRKGTFDPEETEDLEDLIVAAYRDAKVRVDALAAQKLGGFTEMLGGPGGPGGTGGAGGPGPGGQLGL